MGVVSLCPASIIMCVNVSRIRIWTFLDTWNVILSSICILYINTHAYIYLSSWNRGNEIAGVFSLLLASIIMYINISRSRFYDVYCPFLYIYIYMMWISESSWMNVIVIVGLVSWYYASIIMYINGRRLVACSVHDSEHFETPE